MAGAISGAHLGLERLPIAAAHQLTDQGTWGFAALVELAHRCHALKIAPQTRFEERRYGIQGDARADAAFFSAIHDGHLCSGDYARQARCASGGGVADVSS